MTKQAIILAGGRGTRLRCVVGDQPKALTNVGGRPLLEHQMELCARHGFFDVLLLLGHGAAAIRAYVGDGSRFGLKVKSVEEQTPLGNAGAVFAACDDLSERFMVIYGDTMLDVDLDRMWSHHLQCGAAATLFVHPNDHPFDSDLVTLNAEDRITGFSRWNKDEAAMRNMVNAALYVVERTRFLQVVNRAVPGGFDFARHVFPEMLRGGALLAGYRSVEYIKDMGTPERLAQVNVDILHGRVDPTTSGRERSAVFLDRDGTLNIEKNGILDAKELKLIVGAGVGVRRLNRAGIATVVITNQPYVSHGTLSFDAIEQIHAKLEEELARQHAFVDAIYFCPHHPNGGYAGEVSALKMVCQCRKPEPGLIHSAADDLKLDLSSSWLIGDQTADMEAASRGGIRSILVRTGYAGKDGRYTAKPSYTFDNVEEASEFIVEIYPRMRRKADDISSSVQRGATILIGGPSRSGKSTWTQVLSEALRARGHDVVLLCLDDWLREEAEQTTGVAGRYDLSAAQDFLEQLKQEQKPINIGVPSYDRFMKRRLDDKVVTFHPGSVILVEGVLALALDAPRAHKFSIHTYDHARRKRFVSLYQWRGLDIEKINELWVQREHEEIPAILKTYGDAEALGFESEDTVNWADPKQTATVQ